MWKIIEESDRPHTAIRRMRIACWIAKAADTHSEYVILITFPRKNGYANVLQCYDYTYIACLVFYVRLWSELTFNAYWLRDAPTGLIFKDCTFCPDCINLFCIYLGTNSDLCHLQHKLVFITEMKSVYCAVWAESLNIIVSASSL